MGNILDSIHTGRTKNDMILASLTPLCQEVFNGNLQGVLSLIHEGFDVNGVLSATSYSDRVWRDKTPLCVACEYNRLDIAAILIENGADVNMTMKVDAFQLEYTPLYTALECGNTEMVKLLMENGADINKTSKIGGAVLGPFFVALIKGNLEVVNLLIEKGADVNQIAKIDNNDFTTLCVALFERHYEVIQLLIENGADINKTMTVDNAELTLLFVAACEGKWDLVKIVIAHGADVNKTAELWNSELTLLYVAVVHRNTEVVRLLIENGADVNKAIKVGDKLNIALQSQILNKLLGEEVFVQGQYKDGYTPLYLTAEMGLFEIANLLVNNGADFQAFKQFNNSALHVASENGHTNIVLLLLDNGADINAANIDQETPLHVAVNEEHDHRDVVEVLLQRGADVMARDKNGLTCSEKAKNFGQLDIKELILSAILNAAKSGNVELLMYLLDVGHDVNARDQLERTPLYLASMNGHIEAVRLLSDKGADIHAKDSQGATSLIAATQAGHRKLVQFLLERGANHNEPDMPEVTTAQFINASERTTDVTDGAQEVPISYILPESSRFEEEQVEDIVFNCDNKRDDPLSYLLEIHISNGKKFSKKFANTSAFISEIETILNEEIAKKNSSLKQLTIKNCRTLKEKEREAAQLQRRIDEMQKHTVNLSQEREKEREEFAHKMFRLEGEKTRLKAQIEEIKKVHQEELVDTRKKNQRQLETLRDLLLKDGERRIQKLESRIDRLERDNHFLRDKNVNPEGRMEQLAIEYEEDQTINLSSSNAETSVTVKTVVKFKRAAGLLEATKGLRERLDGVGGACRVTINNNNILSSGSVYGTFTGNLGALAVN